MPSKTYDISRQLFQWLIAYDTTISEMAEEFNGADETKIIAWMNGKRVYRNTLDAVAAYFHTTTENFYGKPLRITRREQCGVAKVLEILNREGRDYIADNDDYQQNQHDTTLYAKNKRMINVRIGYNESVLPSRKQDNEHS